MREKNDASYWMINPQKKDKELQHIRMAERFAKRFQEKHNRESLVESIQWKGK